MCICIELLDILNFAQLYFIPSFDALFKYVIHLTSPYTVLI